MQLDCIIDQHILFHLFHNILSHFTRVGIFVALDKLLHVPTSLSQPPVVRKTLSGIPKSCGQPPLGLAHCHPPMGVKR